MQLLLELLNTQPKFDAIVKTSNYWRALLTINDTKFRISLHRHDEVDDDAPTRLKNVETWSVIFVDLDVENRVGITGKGGELKIFSAVKTLLTEFFKEVDPKQIYFSADSDEPSRIKLYQRMVQKLCPPGYNYREKLQNGEHYFYIYKKASS